MVAWLTLRTMCLALISATIWISSAHLSVASVLVIYSNASDPAPRSAWEQAIQRFQTENPDIDVRFNIFDHESYKKSIRNWLTSAPPDVVFWFAGTRMRQFVDLGLLLDVSALFTADVKSELHHAAIDRVTVHRRQYGVPYAHYHIGLFFRRDIFERAGVSEPPRDWMAFLMACDKLKIIGVEPIAIGTQDLWPAAAWF